MISIRTLAISALLCATALPAAAASGTLTTLYTFTGYADGFAPASGVIVHGGTLYGTTEQGIEGNCVPGGNGPCGSVYAINKSTGAEATLHTFTGTDGAFAIAPLLFTNGLLYGTALRGGAGCAPNGCGVVFSVHPNAGHETILYTFAGGADGANPASSLIYQSGLLYGTTSAGAGTGCGSLGCGTIYSLDPVTGRETILYTFTGGADGSGPYGTLAVNGTTLYGITDSTVFLFDLTTKTLATLHTFTGGTDGSEPIGGVIYQTGLLYGNTIGGGQGCGTSGCGTVYQVDSTSGAETILYRFPGDKKGQNPRGSVIFENGSLYGTTLFGGLKGCNGKYGCGTIYRFNLAAGKAAVLHSFAGGTDGVQPYAGLAFAHGAFYGTTISGGALPSGTVFKYTR
jgi:uncharacterized repeat protein (TIGR03803 family)